LTISVNKAFYISWLPIVGSAQAATLRNLKSTQGDPSNARFLATSTSLSIGTAVGNVPNPHGGLKMPGTKALVVEFGEDS
jgi:hypothetical protein